MNLREHVARWLPAVAGVVVGLVTAGYQRYRALAAVRVRPGLADVGLVDAAFTNHGTDWLFYHHPIPATVATVAFWAVLGVFVSTGWSR